MDRSELLERIELFEPTLAMTDRSSSSSLPGNNLLGEVSHLRGHRTHRIDDGLPHFIFAGAALAGPTQVELRVVLVPDRQAALASSDPSL
jgi:hypothetical protein